MMKTHRAKTPVELLAKVYEYHGWRRAVGEERARRVNELYDVSIHGDYYVATPKKR
jgi:hypothetical protein